MDPRPFALTGFERDSAVEEPTAFAACEWPFSRLGLTSPVLIPKTWRSSALSSRAREPLISFTRASRAYVARAFLLQALTGVMTSAGVEAPEMTERTEPRTSVKVSNIWSVDDGPGEG